MKNILNGILTGFFLLIMCIDIHAQELKGYIRDKDSRENLPGATIYVPDLRTGAISDIDGKYFLNNLPKRKLLVQVRLIGYATISQTIDLESIQEQDFLLTMTAIEKSEIVVTGSAFTTDVKRTSVVVSPIDRLKITSTASDNLVQSLSNSPGISVISTGNAISKPVIRGLSFNRVVVVNEGIRQEGQQWGDEHGLEIDQFSADRIEVLKGPSSLLYGSDALGGVINILEPVPPVQGKINAEINSQYSSNNSLYANSIMTEGNLKGIIWRGRGTYKTAASFKTPVETVYNSAYEEKDAELLLGIHKRWGYSHIHASRWFNKIGITEGERDSATGQFLNDQGNIVTQSELDSRELNLPFQNVGHSKISMVNNFIIGQSQLRVNGGFQQNEREEFSSKIDSPQLWMQLRTISYDIKYYFPEKNNLETAIGVSGMTQNNENKGTEFLIPDYTLNDAGVFASVKKSFTLTTLNAGIRYDLRKMEGAELLIDTIPLFKSSEYNFSSLSASAGITHELTSRINFKANIGRGFRAPNISELASNGVHEGTQRYELGNPNLHPETSLQFDFGFLYESKILELSLNIFLNNIDNFIYSREITNETRIVDGNEYPVFAFVQGQSTLKGGEFTLDIHPIKKLHFENSLSYVEGQNEVLNNPLPFIPPLKVVNELKYEEPGKSGGRLQDSYLKVEFVNTAKQTQIDAFETVTKGYSLVNFGIGTKFRISSQTATFYTRINNLFNAKYFDHLSRMKEIGVYGTSRNISMGIILPIGIR